MTQFYSRHGIFLTTTQAAMVSKPAANGMRAKSLKTTGSAKKAIRIASARRAATKISSKTSQGRAKLTASAEAA